MAKKEGMEDWLRRKPDTFKHHLANPDVDVDRYTRDKRLALGAELTRKRRVYLDTKQWVQLRDVVLGRPRNDAHKEMLGLLTDLVVSGRAICPISYSIFIELLSQNDLVTRRATGDVIDALALGCCAQPPHILSQAEILHYFHRILLPNIKLYPPIGLAWTKASFVMGDRLLNVKGVPRHVAAAMAKTMDDLLWSVSLGELLAQLDGEPPPLPDPSSLAEQLTKGKVQHADDFETFDEVFLHEVEGVLDGHIDLLADIMVHLGQKTGCAAEPPPDQRRRAGRYLANLIHAAYKEHRVGKELPGILISAGLHAALRCDPNRKYKAGDCEDFRHARVALPYYDIFCTEKSLKHLICTKPLAYDALYGTTVLSDDDEIITALCALKP